MDNGVNGRLIWRRGLRRHAGPTAFVVAMGFVFGAGGCESQAPAPPAVVPRPSTISGLAWQSGDRYGYRTKLTSKLAMQGGEMMDLALESTLVLDARSLRANAVELAARLENPKFEETDPELKKKFEALGKELEQAFTFTLVKGKLSDVRLPHGWSTFAASISRTIAASLQMAERETDGGDTWTVKELDGTGPHDVEYRRVGSEELAKRKVSYGQLPVPGSALNFNLKLVPKVASSRGKILFARADGAAGERHGRLRRLEYDETIEASLGPRAPLTSHTKVELELVGTERPQAPFDWTQVSAATRAMAPNAPYGQSAPRASYDSVRIGDYTLDRAIRELEEQAKDPKSNRVSQTNREEPFSAEARQEREASLLEQGRVFDATAALLRTEPKNIPILVAKIRAGSPAVRAFLDALSAAGTAEAQRALVELMNDKRLTNGMRKAAAFSLTRTESATSTSVEALTRHLGPEDGLRIHALYGLGTIARRMREAGETERARTIVESLTGVLARTTGPEEQVHVLRSIANSGHPSAFVPVQPFLKATEEKIRTAAVDAIRLMDRPEVDAIIADRLSHDTAKVQGAALDAIAVRKPSDTLAKALVEAAKTSRDPNIRTKAVRLMGRWLPDRPEFRLTLEGFAHTDDREQVRRAARSALGT